MEEYTCPICLEIIEEKDQCIINCNHIFCKSCLDNYITQQNKNTCPLCRGEIKNYSHQEYLHNFIYTTIENIRENPINETIFNINHKLRRYLWISCVSLFMTTLFLNYRSNQLQILLKEYNKCILNETYHQQYIDSLEEQNYLLLHSNLIPTPHEFHN